MFVLSILLEQSRRRTGRRHYRSCLPLVVRMLRVLQCTRLRIRPSIQSGSGGPRNAGERRCAGGRSRQEITVLLPTGEGNIPAQMIPSGGGNAVRSPGPAVRTTSLVGLPVTAGPGTNTSAACGALRVWLSWLIFGGVAWLFRRSVSGLWVLLRC